MTCMNLLDYLHDLYRERLRSRGWACAGSSAGNVWRPPGVGIKDLLDEDEAFAVLARLESEEAGQ